MNEGPDVLNTHLEHTQVVLTSRVQVQRHQTIRVTLRHLLVYQFELRDHLFPPLQTDLDTHIFNFNTFLTFP